MYKLSLVDKVKQTGCPGGPLPPGSPATPGGPYKNKNDNKNNNDNRKNEYNNMWAALILTISENGPVCS